MLDWSPSIANPLPCCLAPELRTIRAEIPTGAEKMSKKRKSMALTVAIASSIIPMAIKHAFGQNIYTWAGNAGDGVWQTGASQANWDPTSYTPGFTYSPGNGGTNDFIFADPN